MPSMPSITRHPVIHLLINPLKCYLLLPCHTLITRQPFLDSSPRKELQSCASQKTQENARFFEWIFKTIRFPRGKQHFPCVRTKHHPSSSHDKSTSASQKTLENPKFLSNFSKRSKNLGFCIVFILGSKKCPLKSWEISQVFCGRQKAGIVFLPKDS